MAMCIGSSVAELVSAYPTAGGMYFVTKHVVPESQVPIFAWIQGWCNLLGQTAGVSSVAYTVSQMLLACASMNSDLVDGSYSYSPYVDWCIFLVLCLLTSEMQDRAADRSAVDTGSVCLGCDMFDDYQDVARDCSLVCAYQWYDQRSRALGVV